MYPEKISAGQSTTPQWPAEPLPYPKTWISNFEVTVASGGGPERFIDLVFVLNLEKCILVLEVMILGVAAQPNLGPVPKGISRVPIFRTYCTNPLILFFHGRNSFILAVKMVERINPVETQKTQAQKNRRPWAGPAPTGNLATSQRLSPLLIVFAPQIPDPYICYRHASADGTGPFLKL